MKKRKEKKNYIQTGMRLHFSVLVWNLQLGLKNSMKMTETVLFPVTF